MTQKWAVGSNPTLSAKNAQIAQSVEQRTENPRVAGSIPALGTSNPLGIQFLEGFLLCKRMKKHAD